MQSISNLANIDPVLAPMPLQEMSRNLMNLISGVRI
jgi:hypothetical protein